MLEAKREEEKKEIVNRYRKLLRKGETCDERWRCKDH